MSEHNDPQAEPPPSPKPKTVWRGWMTFAVLFGILLPIGVTILELATHMCSTIFFDPAPTAAHVILLACVPIANLAVLLMSLRGNFTLAKPITFLLGVSTGTAFVYSLIFLPLAPFSVIGLVFFGFGICGLSPFLALAASIVSGRRFKELAFVDERSHRKTLWAGIVVAVVVIGLHIASTAVTNVGLGMAQSRDESTAARGVRMIRRFGSENVLLRACYDLPTNYWPYGSLEWRGWDRTSRDQARTTYYRVTGRQFNAVPPPRLIGFRSEMTSDFQFDPDVGGTAVNSQITDLALDASRIEAVVDPNALTAYTEWTMTFRNSTGMDREARAEIALPPGGVVSRLTLWVNGEEREAAFAGRGKVREAYQQVAVVQQRDPVLVTSCGPDRVLMQCFPVPAGRTMKVRVGITSPLAPETMSKALYVLPRFAERNFGVPDGIEHSIILAPATDPAVQVGPAPELTQQMMLTDGELSHHGPIARDRDPKVTRVYSQDVGKSNRWAIMQEIRKGGVTAPKSIFIVMDGSLASEKAKGEVVEALDALPKDSRFSILWAGDESEQVTSLQPVSDGSIRDARADLMKLKSIGGTDNRPALLKALYTASGQPNSTVVWVCGPQPFEAGPRTEQILQFLERNPDSITIHALATGGGRNNVTAELDRTGAISAVPRLGEVGDDLTRLFDRWNGRSIEVVRTRVPSREAGYPAWGRHVTRLWAYDEVMRIIRRRDTRLHADAAAFAGDYQIVTPVSGAVVLETKQQYKENGLKPVDPNSTPSVVPEPSSWLALGIGFAGLAAMCLYRKWNKPTYRRLDM